MIKKSTLEEIGEVFGVSAMSVSNALNRRKGISEKKAAAIREYAESIGFRPAYMARSLGQNRTRMIGICMRANLGDPWAGELMHRLQDELRQRRFHVNIILADSGLESEKWALNFFNELRVDAVIIGPLLLDQYRAVCDSFRGLPYVMSFGSTTPLPIDHVKLSEFEGARIAVEHLIERGYRRIGHVGIRLESPLTEVHGSCSRHAGFCNTILRHQLELREEWIFNAPNEEEGVAETMLDAFLAGGRERPDAWFFQSDTIAARCYKVFFRHGMKIPDDTAIVGVDNSPLSRIVYPELTSIDYDFCEYARQIVDVLLAGLEEEEGSPSPHRELRCRELAPRLIVRQSVGTRN